MKVIAPDTKEADRTMRHSHALEASIAASGAVVGTTLGAIAGPVGMVAGGVIGSALGAVAGHAMDDEEERRSLHDQELDREIGVEGGDMGARPSSPPPAKK